MTLQRNTTDPVRERWHARIALPMLAVVLGVTGCAGMEPTDGSPAPGAVAETVVKSEAPAQFPGGTLYRLLVAEFALRRGQPAAAVETYIDIARETRDPAVAERATRIAVYARDEAAGLDAASHWVEIAPDNVEAARVLAVLLIRAGKTDAAVETLRDIAARWNDDAGRGYELVGELLERERDKGKRVELMERVVAGAEQDVYAQAALARVAARSGEAEKATALLRRAYELDPSVDKHAALYASMLRTEGKVEEGLAVLAKQVERHPDEQEIRMVYARFLVDAKRFEEARGQFEKIAEVEPERSDARYALGLLLLQTNHQHEAKVQFEKLLDIGERRLEAHYYLGQIAEAEGEDEPAIAHYRRVDRGDQYLNAQIRVAAIYTRQGRLDRARQHLGAAHRESVGDDIRLIRAEAELLVQSELADEAIAVYDAALEAHPKNTDLLYARAMLAARVDRFEIVERDLREILEHEPNNADALNALGYTMADRTDRLEEAYGLIKRAHDLKPTDHYVIDSLGWVLFRLGRHEEAEEHLRRALEIRADAEVAAHLGEVLWVLGRHNEAREVWDTALKLTPNDKRLLDTINRLSK